MHLFALCIIFVLYLCLVSHVQCQSGKPGFNMMSQLDLFKSLLSRYLNDFFSIFKDNYKTFRINFNDNKFNSNKLDFSLAPSYSSMNIQTNGRCIV